MENLIHARTIERNGLNYKEAEKVVLKDMTKKFSINEITNTLQQASVVRIEMEHEEIRQITPTYRGESLKEA